MEACIPDDDDSVLISFSLLQDWILFLHSRVITVLCAQELAPQDAKGVYQRPSYSFGNNIGEPQFPLVPNRSVER